MDDRPPGCENEGGIAMVNGTLRLFSWRRWGRREWESDAKKSAIVHLSCLWMSVVRSTKKLEDFGSCSIRNSNPFGTNGSGNFRYLIVCKVLNCYKFSLTTVYATFLLYFLHQLYTAVILRSCYKYYFLARRYCTITESFQILIKLEQISKAFFIFIIYVGNNNVLKVLYMRAK